MVTAISSRNEQPRLVASLGFLASFTSGAAHDCAASLNAARPVGPIARKSVTPPTSPHLLDQQSCISLFFFHTSCRLEIPES